MHYMHIWQLRIRASSLQFRASKINMALARMDKLVKKLMSNPARYNWNIVGSGVKHHKSILQSHLQNSAHVILISRYSVFALTPKLFRPCRRRTKWVVPFLEASTPTTTSSGYFIVNVLYIRIAAWCLNKYQHLVFLICQFWSIYDTRKLLW